MIHKVTPRQRRALEVLVVTGDKSQAADAAGVKRVTIYRWMQQPGFGDALRWAVAESLDNLSLALVGVSELAVKTLDAAMVAGDATWSARVRAADVSLKVLITVRELVALEARVCELERVAGEKV